MKKINENIINKNGVKLSTTLFLPHKLEINEYALFVNCFTCSKNLHSTKHIAEQLVNQGFGVLSFDFTGLGDSDGEFKDSYFSNNVSDVEDICTFMSNNYRAPSLIIGHSLGGLISIVAASKIPDIKSVVTIGTPSTLAHVTKHFSHGIKEVKEKGEITINIGGRPFKINTDFVNDFLTKDIRTVISELNKPILILHSPADKIVEIENAEQLFANSKFPKSFISLDNSDHLLLNDEDAKYVGNVIINWAKRNTPQVVVSKTDVEGSEIIARLDLLNNNFTTLVETKKHSFIVDEPGKLGGDAFGPAPYDYVLGALASCTAMTIKVYAERSGWKLNEVQVFASHKKNYNNDMEKSGYLESINKRIYISGNLREDQRERLIRIASTCPVHKTLESTIKIETETINN